MKDALRRQIGVAAEAEDLAVRSTTEAQPERIEAPDNADVLASWRNFLRFIIYLSICLRREHSPARWWLEDKKSGE
jgi:hypothetical protein